MRVISLNYSALKCRRINWVGIVYQMMTVRVTLIDLKRIFINRNLCSLNTFTNSTILSDHLLLISRKFPNHTLIEQCLADEPFNCPHADSHPNSQHQETLLWNKLTLSHGNKICNCALPIMPNKGKQENTQCLAKYNISQSFICFGVSRCILLC